MLGYCYNKANYNILSAKLNDVDWAGISETLSVNDYWEKLKSVLINFKENSIPQFNRRKVNDLPWFNTKLKKLIKKRNNLFKRYKKNCLSYSKIKYIIARNYVTKMVKEAKKKYETNIIKRSRKNRKVFYTYVACKNRKNGSKRIGPLTDSSGKIALEDRDVVLWLNRYFSSVFASKTKASLQPLEENKGSSNDTQSLIITENLVSKIIGGFKEHKSPGIDGITSTYAIKTKDLLAEPLKFLYTNSIQRNEIPEDWKRANITPIFKKGDKANVENYIDRSV